MKEKIDHILSRLAQRTHDPRGRHAATQQTYQSLLDRIPTEQRPVIGQPKLQHRGAFPRWSAAACLWLVVSIGLAIAGIWYHQYQHTPSDTESLPISEQSGTILEPRTLTYQQAPLAQIAADLSAAYCTSILIVDPELSEYCVTATFRTDEPLAEILSILAEIGNFEVHETPEGYYLAPCKK